MDANKDPKGGITVHGVSINNLKFADNIDLIEASSSSLQEVAQLLNEQGKRSGVVINKAKTQTMATGKDKTDQPVKINDYTLKNVTWFTYLGSVFTYDNECSQNLRTRSSKATEVTKSMENIWKSKNITNDTKTYIGNNNVQHSAIWVLKLDIQLKDQRQTAGISDVLLLKYRTRDYIVAENPYRLSS